MTSKDPGFRVLASRYGDSQIAGSQINFENGYRVSVEFGTNVSCANHNENPDQRFRTPRDEQGFMCCPDAEFTVVDLLNDNEFITERFVETSGETYKAYILPSEVAPLIAKVAKAKRPKRKKKSS